MQLAAHEIGFERACDRLAPMVAFVLGIVLFLLPIGRSSEVPVAVLALIGLALLLLGGFRRWRSASARLLPILFLCYWLPALCSAPDAVASDKSWSTVLVDLRFLPFGAAVVFVLGPRPDLRQRVLDACALLLLLWALDAMVQAATGVGLGGRLAGDRVSGIFGDDNLKLGPVLAVLSPLALQPVLQSYGRAAFAGAWLLLAAAVLLAGARAGWVSFALVSVLMLWRESGNALRFAQWSGLAVAGVLAIAFIAYQASPRFAARIDRTVVAANADAQDVDFALAGRVPIWTTAMNMALAHPLNGVGVRGFRYAYSEYAAPDDPWVNAATGQGALHPHQLVLEVAAETGVIGLLAWLAGAVLAWRAYFTLAPAARAPAFAPGLALLAMTFPLNSHFAFYSSFWALMFWWLLALYLSALEQPAGALEP
jgi:O-antigen ligase